jgi:hypothetical protein
MLTLSAEVQQNQSLISSYAAFLLVGDLASAIHRMAECRWLKPVPAGQFEYVEWTNDAHLCGTVDSWRSAPGSA